MEHSQMIGTVYALSTLLEFNYATGAVQKKLGEDRWQLLIPMQMHR